MERRPACHRHRQAHHRPLPRAPKQAKRRHNQPAPSNTSGQRYNNNSSQILFIASIFLLVLLQTSQQFSLMPDGSSSPKARSPRVKDAPDGSLAKSAGNSLSSQQHRYIYPNFHQLASWKKRPARSGEEKEKEESISVTSGGATGASLANSAPSPANLNAFRYELAETGGGGGGGASAVISKFNMQPPEEPSGSPPADRVIAAAANHSSGPNRIKLIQEQIIQLRRQLENELVGTKKGVQVNSTACSSSADCSKWIPHSHCNLDALTCACLPQHEEFNSTTCLPPSLLGAKCLVDGQCRQKVANSVCQGQVCACLDNFVPYRKDKCLPASEINNFCLTDRQCQLADRHSHCKWRIQNIYGLCGCPPNYLAVTYPPASAASGQALARVSKATVRATTTKCAPRLGDFCFDNQECLWATGNSTCRLPSTTEEAQGPQWRSSLAPGVQRKCFCAPGFRESSNRLRCEQIQDFAKPAILSQEDQARASGLLERGLLSEYKKFMESLVSLTGRRQEVAKPETSAISTRPAVKLRASSLGKSCSSRLECQLADKFSDCLAGVCECVRPSRSCSANSTGCHKDTFQCRSGQCISRFFVCDNFRNCDDGSDEEGCQEATKCPPESFQCQSGQCLPLGKICNGKADCPDGSDELLCNARLPSSNVLLAAGNSSQNMQLAAGGKCEPRAFTCDDGKCLPGYVFCNAIAECADGSDENRLLCLGPSAANVTSSGEPKRVQQQQPELKDSTVIKTDRTVINELLRRQQLRNQNAGSARVKFSRRQPKLEAQFRLELNENKLGGGLAPAGGQPIWEHDRQQQDCPDWAFACRNGKCRSGAILCSGVDGCGDNSDEDRCQVCQCEAP